VLEDFLDGWPGTLVVVSHDRYFLERVCDTVWALLGDGEVRMLPRGVEEYLEHRAAAHTVVPSDTAPSAATSATPSTAASAASSAEQPASSAEQREARKTIARIDRQLSKIANRESELHAELSEHAADYEKLAELDVTLRQLTAEKEALEEEWLEAASLLE
jgi:ATP-binding cassette subfamily F protein uup